MSLCHLRAIRLSMQPLPAACAGNRNITATGGQGLGRDVWAGHNSLHPHTKSPPIQIAVVQGTHILIIFIQGTLMLGTPIQGIIILGTPILGTFPFDGDGACLWQLCAPLVRHVSAFMCQPPGGLGRHRRYGRIGFWASLYVGAAEMCVHQPRGLPQARAWHKCQHKLI